MAKEKKKERKLSNMFRKRKMDNGGLDIAVSSLYDYSSKEAREKTAMFLLSYSQSQRSQTEERWQLMNDYYNGDHRTAVELQAMLEAEGIPFEIACVQDPYLHVESQIIPDIPTFEFNGRDDDLDNMRAKQREYAVQFVLDNNEVNSKNTKNERRLNKLGNACWKVYWDATVDVPGTMVGGEIIVDDAPIKNCYPDPSALSVDDCEYFNFVYPMHIRKAARKWKKELKANDITLSPNITIGVDNIFNSDTEDNNAYNIEVFEHWYRDDDGDISLSMLINGEEFMHVPKYWIKTGMQNKKFPFVMYCKIQDENEFWDRSEIEQIIELTDAADRELAYGLLNTAMNGAGRIFVEENALADGSSIENRPFGITTMKNGKLNAIRLESGNSGLNEVAGTISYLQDQMERTIGNFDTTMGQEPARVTTSSGIAQINERADARKNIKKADRNTGFKELFQLIDWTCLEFYDEERMIFLGADNEEANKRYAEMNKSYPGLVTNLDKDLGPIIFKYSSKAMQVKNDRQELYFPKIDATVQTSDSLVKSKAFSVQSLKELSQTPITPQNVELVKEQVDLLQLPGRKTIKEALDKAVGVTREDGTAPNVQDVLDQLSPEEQAAIQQNPALLSGLGGE